ncbi:MAG TPA: DapH/DapD/GlmU-related protein [Bacteriovoracaceae bacterium]|nr:DapH/DapD/GlmU-related protein [Bacteriovoracaceae bacterium]
MVVLQLGLVTAFILTHHLALVPVIIFFPYVFPLLVYRTLLAFFPYKEGGQYLGVGYNMWNGAYKIQNFFYAFPYLERVLVLFGFYSAWLRLWGSKIGKNVFWTSHTLIGDRQGMIVGDNALFGHGCSFISHVVHIRDGKVFLYYKPIKIGRNVFVGAGSRMGPGTTIKDNTRVPVLTDLMVSETKGPEDFGATSDGDLEIFYSRG